MTRILNAEPEGYSEKAKAILKGAGDVVEERLTRERLIRRLPGFDVLIVRLGIQVDREVMDAGRRLKAIVSATTGLDHIDTEYARGKGVAVLSLKGEREFLKSVRATAEHTWALLLSLIRRVPQAFGSVREGAWDRDRFRGSELFGKRLGLVGLGRIGSMVAGYGLAFGMKVAAYDPLAEEWPDGVERKDSLAALLGVSDVVSLHTNLDEKTRKLIGPAELGAMRPDAILVNTSRGDLVDEDALLSALASGRLMGAALDVVSGERGIGGGKGVPPLVEYARAHDNLLITPHVAGATRESMEKTEIFMARKLSEFLKDSGRRPWTEGK